MIRFGEPPSLQYFEIIVITTSRCVWINAGASVNRNLPSESRRDDARRVNFEKKTVLQDLLFFFLHDGKALGSLLPNVARFKTAFPCCWHLEMKALYASSTNKALLGE